MTEKEWSTNEDPEPMLKFLEGKASERKLRLFAVACFRPYAEAVRGDEDLDQSYSYCEILERYADGAAMPIEVDHFLGRDDQGVQVTLPSPDEAARVWVNLGSFPPSPTVRERAILLRCIFGNPFRSVTFCPSWLTETVTVLAAGIYADRAFDRLPILADALQEAGCEDEQVLSHCRGDGPHARGCWVVDGLLGKG